MKFSIFIILTNVVHASHWIPTWTAMPQLTEYTNLPPAPFNETNLVFLNSTIRQTVHITVGGPQIRLRLSNAFGYSPIFGPINLAITAVSVSHSVDGRAVHQTVPVTFSGNQSFIIPNGALVVSDPLNFPVKPQSNLTITLYLANGQASNYITSHPGSRATSWFSFGNYVDALNMTDSSTQSIAHWYFISAVEVWVPQSSRALTIVGDSITDGRGSDTDKNNRWPDLLLARMQSNSITNIAVVNQAAGGNCVLKDGLGPNALGRIDRDVLAQSGVRYAMIFEGVNDIGTTENTTAAQNDIGNRLIAAYQQMITRVHSFGIPIFAATITPFSAPGYNTTVQPYSDAVREGTRQRVNTWIRSSGKFDAVVDFDKILSDPTAPSQLNPKFNSGDYLHPNVAGYQVIANAFPLRVFGEFELGVEFYI